MATLLKAEPLTVDEVNRFGVCHINKYTKYSLGEVYDNNGYGGMAYYSSETCGNGNWECTIDYNQSDIKYVVDAWATANIPNGLEEARLISIDDLTNNLGYNSNSIECTTSCYYRASLDDVPTWVYSSNYSY